MLNLLIGLALLFSVPVNWKAFAADTRPMQALYDAQGAVIYVGEGRGVVGPHIEQIRGGNYARNVLGNECYAPTDVELQFASAFGLTYQIYRLSYGKTQRVTVAGVKLTEEGLAALRAEFRRQHRWLSARTRSGRQAWCRAWEITTQQFAKRLGFTYKVEVVR